MIEVEKKFFLREQDIERLITNSIFLSEKTFTDTYYDTQKYSLTTKDLWLRSRDNKWELKIPLHDVRRLIDQYKELENEEEIRDFLSLPKKGNFTEVLRERGYMPFCTVTTTRKKYKKDDFIIDLDTLDFGYSVGEIELMVESIKDIEIAIQKITRFAQEHQLPIIPVRGKVAEYLKRNSSDHYAALKAAGVIL